MLRELDRQRPAAGRYRKLPLWKPLDELCPDLPEWRTIGRLADEDTSSYAVDGFARVEKPERSGAMMAPSGLSGDGAPHHLYAVKSVRDEQPRWTE